MKNNVKKLLAVVLALGLVIVAGKFTSDYYLKATDGDENIVDEEAATEENSEDASEEIIIESDAVSDEEIAESADVIDGEEPEETEADAENKDELLEEDEEECQHVDEDEDGVCDLCGTKLEDLDEDKECEHIDEDGDGICDKCGEQMEECEHIDEDEDGICDKCGKKVDLKKKKNTEGSVSISSNVEESMNLEKGTKVTLTANVEGYEDCDYHFEWYRAKQDSDWELIDGVDGAKYSFTLDENHNGYKYRVCVIIED